MCSSIYGGSDSNHSYLDLFNETHPIISAKLAVPLDNNDGLHSIVSLTLCRAPYIAIVALVYEENNVSELEIIPNTLRSTRKASCLDILNWLKSIGVDVIVVPRTEKTLDILKKSDIRFILVDPGSTLREVLELFLNR